MDDVQWNGLSLKLRWIDGYTHGCNVDIAYLTNFSYTIGKGRLELESEYTTWRLSCQASLVLFHLAYLNECLTFPYYEKRSREIVRLKAATKGKY